MYIAVIDSEFGDDVLVSDDFEKLVDGCCDILALGHGVVVHDIGEIREAECNMYLSVDFYEYIAERDGVEAVKVDM